jgi:hypothetical protein
MLAISGNLRLGARETRRAYLGSTPVFAAEQTRWGTDFGEYATGSPPRDWTSFDWQFLDSWEITSGGLISGNRMRITAVSPGTARRGALFLWEVLPEVENSEVLILASRGASNNLDGYHGAGQRIRAVAGNDNDGILLGARDNATQITRRPIADSAFTSGENADHGGTYAAGSALWMRGRWDGTNFRARAWMADTDKSDLGWSDEPSSWQLDGTFETTQRAGRTGIAFVARRCTAAESEVFIHYFGVGIDGDSAPPPAFAPARPPDPGPDPDTFDTFDSTATSFDSTGHTFDEVA